MPAQAEIQDQRRVAGWHPDRVLDEWVRAAACAGPRGARRPHAMAPLLPYLEPYVTVHALDRRGRGACGDAPEYRLERECQDVASVVDTVTPVAGQPVSVCGHSHGGIVAFGAAAMTTNVRRLDLYEGWPVPDPLFTPSRPRL